MTTVQCSSTHLTSFAVLVDVSGGSCGMSVTTRQAIAIAIRVFINYASKLD